MGCLNLESTEKNAFSKDDQAFLELIANIASMYAQFVHSKDAIHKELAGGVDDRVSQSRRTCRYYRTSHENWG